MYKLIYTSFSFILLTVLVAGCSHTADRRLVLADTLMWTAPDSSLAILNDINRDSLTSKEDLAYHALLLTQAQFRCNGNCSSDSLINFALDYYSDNHNREHYTRSLLYKGAYYEFNTNQPVEAMKCYKLAEENADTTDYRNLAQLNMRMGMLYYKNFISTGEDISKFKKALFYNHKLGQKQSELLCLLYIGGKLRVSSDSKAVAFLMQAKKLAVELQDTTSIVNAMQYMCRHFLYDSCYIKAHTIAQECMYSYPNHITEDIILDEARICAKLGKIDSALMYMHLAKPTNGYDITQVYKLYTLADIAYAQGDNKQYAINKRIADSICDEAQIKRDSVKLTQYEAGFNERRLVQAKSQNDNILRLSLVLIAALVLLAILLVFNNKKKKEWKFLLEEHKNANVELIRKNVEMSNVNLECKNAIFDLMKQIDSWVKQTQSLPRDVFANKFEASFVLGKKKKEIRIENGEFWTSINSLADATFGNELKMLEEKYPKLSKDDLYIIALKYLGFSYITIAVCMGYKDKSYVNKKKDRILKKLGLDITFDEFLNSFKNKE